jgi:hypothetical protein
MRLFISAVFLFCCQNCFGQFISPVKWWDSYEGKYLDLGKLKGKFSSIEIKGYTATDYFGELKLQALNFVMTFQYDMNNQIIKVDGSEDGKKISDNISYIINPLVFEMNLIGFEGEQKINVKNLWRYDSNGNIIEFTRFENDSIKWKEFAKYNEKNKLLEFKEYKSSGKILYQRNYKYDQYGNEVEYVFRSEDSYSITNKIYNTNNQIIEKKVFSDLTNSISIDRYKYNVEAKLIEENHIFNGSPLSKVKITYNSKGKKASITKYDWNNNISETETFVYNSDGALIEQVFNNEHKKIYKSYEYDHIGNWIKKTEYSVSPPTALPSQYTITERKINYR